VIRAARGASRDTYVEGFTKVGPIDESTDTSARSLYVWLKDPAGLARMGSYARRRAQTFAPENYTKLSVESLL